MLYFIYILTSISTFHWNWFPLVEVTVITFKFGISEVNENPTTFGSNGMLMLLMLDQIGYSNGTTLQRKCHFGETFITGCNGNCDIYPYLITSLEASQNDHISIKGQLTESSLPLSNFLKSIYFSPASGLSFSSPVMKQSSRHVCRPSSSGRVR